MVLYGLVWLLALALLARWVFTSAPGGQGLPPGQAQQMQNELARLREEVDRLGGQVERLMDEQRFLLRLLEQDPERPRLHPGERPDPDR